MNTHPKTITPKAVVSKKPSGWAAKKAFADRVSGYDSTSPIWGKQLPEVITILEDAIDAGNDIEAKSVLQHLRNRIARGQLLKAQR